MSLGKTLTLTCALAFSNHALGEQSEPPAALIDFATAESNARLARATAKNDFFVLANHFEGQITRGHCAVASAVIVMNALRVGSEAATLPRDRSVVPAELLAKVPPQFDPIFARYTQSAFFDAKTEAVKRQAQFFGQTEQPSDKRDGGFQLRQLHQVLRAHGFDSQIRVVAESTTETTIRKEIVENLSKDSDFVLVNYLRPALGQKGGGHVSPVGAYDSVSDAFLVLDVNTTDQRWVWISTSDLVRAMRTKDTIENRGYLLVRDGPAAAQ